MDGLYFAPNATQPKPDKNAVDAIYRWRVTNRDNDMKLKYSNMELKYSNEE